MSKKGENIAISSRLIGAGDSLKGILSCIPAANIGSYAPYRESASGAVNINAPLCTAVLASLEIPMEKGENPIRYASGKLTNGDLVAEMTDPANPDFVILTMYKEKEARFAALVWNTEDSFGRKLKIGDGEVAGVTKAYDATCVYLTLMPLLEENLHFAKAKQEIIEIKETYEVAERALDEDFAKAIADSLYVMSDIVYHLFCKRESVPESAIIPAKDWGSKGTGCTQINASYIEAGKYTVNEVFHGKFQIFDCDFSAEAEIVEIREGEYNLGLEIPQHLLADMVEEKPSFIPGSKVKEFLEMTKMGTKNPQLFTNKNFRFFGPPGAGKSTACKFLAWQLGIPYFHLNLSNGVAEDALLGYLSPRLEDEDEVSSENLTELKAKMPDSVTLEFMPEEAYEQMTGERKSGVSSLEVALMAAELSSKIAEEAVKEALSDSGNGGIKYEYRESVLTKAVRYPCIIEISEVSSVENPTVLTALNALLDDNRQLITDRGVYKRHEHCYIIFTDNFATDIGYSPMNQAVMNRIGHNYVFEAMSAKEMKAAAIKAIAPAKVPKKILDAILRAMECVNEISLDPNNEISCELSFRNFMSCVQKVALGLNVSSAFESSIINGLCTTREEIELLVDAVRNNTNIYELKPFEEQ